MEDMNLNPENLESALDTARSSEAPAVAAVPTETPETTPQMSPEEEVGFHKGALNTLMAERNELAKMVGTVEAIMQAHVKRLEELGVKLQ